jgi:hypothetical protein
MGKCAHHPFNFREGNERGSLIRLWVVTIRQTIGTFKVTDVCNRESQIVKLAVEAIFELLGHKTPFQNTGGDFISKAALEA